MARQHELQPEALHQALHFQKPQSRRSMGTKTEDPEEQEELDRLMRIPARRSFFLHSKTGRAIAACAEQTRVEKHEKLWDKVKRAEARLSITDVPQRRRALDRIYADLVAENAYNLTTTFDHLRNIHSATDQRKVIRMHEEEVQRARSFHAAKWRSVSLYLFAPLGDVGLFSRLGKLLGYVGHFPVFLLDQVMAIAMLCARKIQKRQLEKFARMRSEKSTAEDESNPKDASSKQRPGKSSKGDLRKPRRK